MNIIETNLSFGSLSRRGSTNRIIIHHAEAKNASVETIHSWHKGNGWSGIGYHFYIRKDGSIYRGRPEWAIGAHASGANSDSIGVCFEGNYMTETMPSAQLNAGKELVAWLKDKYGISTVLPHKRVTSTDCPGDNFPFDAVASGSGYTEPTTGGGVQNALGMGDRGEDVADLQRKLIALGYDCGGYGADGIFGAGTDKSVRDFQRARGLTVDGLAGVNTMAALGNATSKPVTGETFPLPSNHWYGMPNADDRNHSGYYNADDRPAIKMIQGVVGVASDGWFGQNTHNAVVNWQRAHGLTADGLVGIKTWSAMF